MDRKRRRRLEVEKGGGDYCKRDRKRRRRSTSSKRWTRSFNSKGLHLKRKELSSSRNRDRMMCCISFSIQLNDNETTEEQRYQLFFLRYLMHVKATKVVCFGHKVAEIVMAELILPAYSNVGAYSFSFFLKDSNVGQTIIDAIVAEINQLQEEGPSERLTKDVIAMLTDRNQGRNSRSAFRQLTHLCFSSSSCHKDLDDGRLKMGEMVRRNNQSFNSETFKALF